MSWTTVTAIAEVAAAVSVVASLLYLAIQVRQNTRQMRLGAYQVTVSELGTALEAQAQNRQLAEVVSRGLQDFETLDAVDRVQFLSHMSHVLRLYEAVFFHHLEGTLDDRVWTGFQAAIADVLAYPGMRATLEMRKHHLSDAFTAYLADLTADTTGRPVFGEVGADDRPGTSDGGGPDTGGGEIRPGACRPVAR